MSEFNKVTIGRSPHDEESLIKGLIRDFENAKNNPLSEDMTGPIWIGSTIKDNTPVNVSGESSYNQAQE